MPSVHLPMAEVERWCWMTVVGPDGSQLAHLALRGSGRPDLATVDGIARAALDARRRGATIVLGDVVPELASLLDLVGLGVEVDGETEGGEEPLGVEEGQEELHPDDPAV